MGSIRNTTRPGWTPPADNTALDGIVMAPPSPTETSDTTVLEGVVSAPSTPKIEPQKLETTTSSLDRSVFADYDPIRAQMEQAQAHQKRLADMSDGERASYYEDLYKTRIEVLRTKLFPEVQAELDALRAKPLSTTPSILTNKDVRHYFESRIVGTKPEAK